MAIPRNSRRRRDDRAGRRQAPPSPDGNLESARPFADRPTRCTIFKHADDPVQGRVEAVELGEVLVGDQLGLLEALGRPGEERTDLSAAGVDGGFPGHAAALRRALVEASR